MERKHRRQSVFRFKQFELSNERSAMKIGTDGVLLGAWFDCGNDASIMDVGAGTGLISLMAAQRSKARIVGVELDHAAAEEAMSNTANSPWHSRIEIIEGDFVAMAKDGLLPQVDHIVSNPPYFNTTLRSPSQAKALARHGDGLDYETLLALAPSLLTAAGRISLIAPADRHDDIIFSASMARLHLTRLWEVATVEGKIPSRLLFELGRVPSGPCQTARLVVQGPDGKYTPEYRKLTEDFYL